MKTIYDWFVRWNGHCADLHVYVSFYDYLIRNGKFTDAQLTAYDITRATGDKWIAEHIKAVSE